MALLYLAMIAVTLYEVYKDANRAEGDAPPRTGFRENHYERRRRSEAHWRTYHASLIVPLLCAAGVQAVFLVLGFFLTDPASHIAPALLAAASLLIALVVGHRRARRALDELEAAQAADAEAADDPAGDDLD